MNFNQTNYINSMVAKGETQAIAEAQAVHLYEAFDGCATEERIGLKVDERNLRFLQETLAPLMEEFRKINDKLDKFEARMELRFQQMEARIKTVETTNYILIALIIVAMLAPALQAGFRALGLGG